MNAEDSFTATSPLFIGIKIDIPRRFIYTPCMDIDLDLYRHEVRVSTNPLVRLSAIDISPDHPQRTFVFIHGFGGQAESNGSTSLSRQEASPAQLLSIRRAHWGIETGLHYS